MSREQFDAGAEERKNFRVNLMRDAARCQEQGVTEQVMLSFTSDPYHPFDTTLTRHTLEVLRDTGMAFCTLSKGGTRVLRDRTLFRPARDAYACTLTSLDDEFSRKWERGAALSSDRIATLRYFHGRDVFTWVSLEPTLSPEHSLAVVAATHRFVDLYKVGRANYLPAVSKTIDWQRYTERMIDLLTKVGARHYIKKDLQPYLPAGYPNQMRVAQHR
jgi:hypothetical protein